MSRPRRRVVPAPPRPPPPEPDPSRLVILTVEASISDAGRALSRARRISSPYREQIGALEELVQLFSRRLLDEANR